MIIEETDLAGGVRPELIARLVRRHRRGSERYCRLMRYYLGEHPILGRKRLSAGVPNNRIVANHARYITDMTTAYMIANPVTYSSSEGYDIEPVKNAYFEQTIANTDVELERLASIFGHSFELVYADEEACPRSAVISPENAFIVYADGAQRRKLLGVYYYEPLNIDGDTKGETVVTVCTESEIIVYRGKVGGLLAEEERLAHRFGDVPMVEYRNNPECQGDFEQQLPLIDAYDLLISDRVNDKEQFVDCFLLLLGIEIDTDKAQRLREQKILMGDVDGRAEYLAKTLSEADTEVLREALKDDIHRFSMVPDLSDENFANNLSGVAIRYKLMGFEQNVKNKERLFEVGLKERFALYNNFLFVKRAAPIVPLSAIDVEFKRNLPVNEYETAQMISLLDGIASRQTLLSRLPFVTDAAEEADLSKKEEVSDV